MGSNGSGRRTDALRSYVTKDRQARPKLVRSAVLYVDVLGVRDMARRGGLTNLRRLEAAVTGRDGEHGYRDFLHGDSPWPAASFSDLLVIASPLLRKGDEESTIAGLLSQAAYLQLALVQSGFFLRGGLTWGMFHIQERFAFGEALVDAVEIEEHVAVNPRIVLGTPADKLMQDSWGDPIGDVPRSLLLRDGDGHAFVNYLAPIFDDPATNPIEPLTGHRDLIVGHLNVQRDHKRRWEKYRWVAEYHNDVVRKAVQCGLLGRDGQPLREPDELLIPAESMTWRFDPFLPLESVEATLTPIENPRQEG